MPLRISSRSSAGDVARGRRQSEAAQRAGFRPGCLDLAVRPERVAGALIVDTLGAAGDGGEAVFDAEMLRRTPREDLDEWAATG